MNKVQRKELEKLIESSYEDILTTVKIQKDAAKMLKGFMDAYIESSGKDQVAYQDVKDLSKLYKASVLDLNFLKKEVLKCIDEIENLDSAKNEDIKKLRDFEKSKEKKTKNKKKFFNNSGRVVLDSIKHFKNQENEIKQKEIYIKKNKDKLMSIKEQEKYNEEKEELEILKQAHKSELKELKEKSDEKNKELRNKMISLLLFLGLIVYFIFK